MSTQGLVAPIRYPLEVTGDANKPQTFTAPLFVKKQKESLSYLPFQMHAVELDVKVVAQTDSGEEITRLETDRFTPGDHLVLTFNLDVEPGGDMPIGDGGVVADMGADLRMPLDLTLPDGWARRSYASTASRSPSSPARPSIPPAPASTSARSGAEAQGQGITYEVTGPFRRFARG